VIAFIVLTSLCDRAVRRGNDSMETFPS